MVKLFSELEQTAVTKTEAKKELKYILFWNEAYGTTEYGFCCGQVEIKNFFLNFIK